MAVYTNLTKKVEKKLLEVSKEREKLQVKYNGKSPRWQASDAGDKLHNLTVKFEAAEDALNAVITELQSQS